MKYKHLEVWKRAHRYTINIYNLTKRFPNEEKYSLTSQMRRAAYSIPMNIVEGHGSLSTKNYIRYLGIARTSAMESEYQLLLSKDIGYLNENDFMHYHDEVLIILKMLTKMIKTLKEK